MPWSLPLFPLLFLALAPLFSPSARASCGFEGLRVRQATPSESAATCEGIHRLAAYFADLGVSSIQPNITVIFEDKVLTPPIGPSKERFEVHGYFDTDTREIHLTHFEAATQKARRPWGIRWTEELATSFLWHEMSHMLAIDAMGATFRSVPHHQQELLAYAIQIDLMSEGLRAEVLGEPVSTFANPADVSSAVYEMDPEFFARKSFLSVQRWGGKKYLADLITSARKGTP